MTKRNQQERKTSGRQKGSKERNCNCFLCKHDHDFDIPDELVSDLLCGRVALFAGAGISTESRNVLKFTLYDDVAEELDIENCQMPFPSLMEDYCRQPNGRYKLLKKIRHRFEHIRSFPGLYNMASRFHQELATFFPIQTIITTNWDTYFEDFCNAVPFVSDEDLAFWNDSERRVLKIHGSINNYGSIVATVADYRKCRKALDRGILGSVLKTILATQTIVFIGYSMNDSDFGNIYDFVLKQMKGMHKQAYIVTPYMDEEDSYRDAGLMPIITDGTYFLSQLKEHAVKQGLMHSDDFYEEITMLLGLVRLLHKELGEKYSHVDFPQVIFALAYQDGMIHGLQRALERRTTGEYSDPARTANILDIYIPIRREKLREKRYDDVAYIQGYAVALQYMTLDIEDRKNVEVPFYFAFGFTRDLVCLEDFEKAMKSLPAAHKASYKYACKWIAPSGADRSVTYHHPPWL